MTIAFQCHSCHNEVKAPDQAAGRMGKCPFCGHSNRIPERVEEEEELIPLAPIDEQEEQRSQRERRALYEQEQALLDASAPAGDFFAMALASIMA